MSREEFRDWVRVTDHHRILHLALLSMSPGEVLCGCPPIGCELSDEVGEVALPGDPDPSHRAVCRYCLAVARPPVPAGKLFG